MRVVANEKMKVFHDHVAITLEAGQEVSGSLAAMLLQRAHGKVTRLDGDRDRRGEDGGQEDAPTSLEAAETAAAVLAWVGDDPARAAEALDAEEARDKPRSTLIKQLSKLIED
ncbi:hypothetical protein GCM10010400_72870 [Streptomyces aculeolatus]|uniref:hypothetical protein n=1 Tax=Streptomyces aculeolatus TaxID=270689 RepID=UPI001CED3D84|nr:hypothetical protein [Streptomyces aculeolatus]